jgi:hypothetical protein
MAWSEVRAQRQASTILPHPGTALVLKASRMASAMAVTASPVAAGRR